LTRGLGHENLEQRLQGIRRVIQSLPQPNFDLLRRVSEHLDKVTDYEEHNHMTAEALAIVFSPNLLRAPQNDFVMILNNMGLSHKLVKALITHVSSLAAVAAFCVLMTLRSSSTPSLTRQTLRPRYILRTSWNRRYPKKTKRS